MSGSSFGTTAVPPPVFDNTGFVAPAESDILTGELSDLNQAMGGNLNQSLSDPPGQLAMSFTAALGDAYDQILAVLNGVDPARAFGRLQDAIGYIYFMTRLPATATVVSVVVTGSANLVIPAGTALVKDGAGNVYVSSGIITLSSLGTATASFSCTTLGPVQISSNTVQINQSFSGVTGVSNPSAGITGSPLETRQQFEARRAASVESNSIGPLNAIRGVLLNTAGVTDAYVIDNPTSSPVTHGGVTIPPGALYVCVNGGTDQSVGLSIITKKPPGVPYVVGAAVAITGGGGTGATGTATVVNGVITALTVTSGGTGYTSAPTVSITGNGTGATGTATITSGAVTALTVTVGGAGYVQSSTVSVVDPNSAYSTPPSYNVTFTRAVALPLFIQATITNNSNVPSNALTLIQAAVMSAFSALAGTQIGQATYASVFYAGIAALGPWVELVEVTIGTAASPTGFVAAANLNQIPTLQSSGIALVLQ